MAMPVGRKTKPRVAPQYVKVDLRSLSTIEGKRIDPRPSDGNRYDFARFSRVNGKNAHRLWEEAVGPGGWGRRMVGSLLRPHYGAAPKRPTRQGVVDTVKSMTAQPLGRLFLPRRRLAFAMLFLRAPGAQLLRDGDSGGQRRYHGYAGQCRPDADVMGKVAVMLRTQSNLLGGNSKAMLAAVRRAHRSLAFVPPALWADRGFVLGAVACHGLALRHADVALRDDPIVAMTAVKHAGVALKYASARLQADRALWLAALKQCGNVLWAVLKTEHYPMDYNTGLEAGYITRGKELGLWTDRGIMLAAARRDSRQAYKKGRRAYSQKAPCRLGALYCIHASQWGSIRSGAAYVSNPLLSDRELVLEAVRR